jgi:hypothetical protein
VTLYAHGARVVRLRGVRRGHGDDSDYGSYGSGHGADVLLRIYAKCIVG